MTMQIIQRIVTSGSQSAITFTDIPNTFTDLYCLVTVRSTSADDGLFFKFNNTTSNTSWRNLLSYSTGTTSQSGSGWLAGGGVRSGTSNTFTNIGITIPNYAGASVKNASVNSTSEEAGSNAYSFLIANRWSDTAAISRIDFYMQTGSIASGSSVTLYGITKGTLAGVTVS